MKIARRILVAIAVAAFAFAGVAGPGMYHHSRPTAMHFHGRQTVSRPMMHFHG